MMPVNYTNRKGVIYTLYKGQTKAGKPRYYFGRASQNQDEPVTEIPSRKLALFLADTQVQA